jgi:hypothetical protein
MTIFFGFVMLGSVLSGFLGMIAPELVLAPFIWKTRGRMQVIFQYGSMFFLSLFFMVFFWAISLFTSNHSQESEHNYSSNSQPTNIAQSPTIPINDQETIKSDQNYQQTEQPPLGLNMPFQLGEFTYIITDVAAATSVGKSYMRRKPQTGAIYMIIRYEIQNDSKETKTVMTDDFKLVDYQQRTFSTSTDASEAVQLSGEDKDFIISQIQPSLKKRMVSVFEVPIDAVNGHDIQLVVPEKGWGTGQYVINLHTQ